MLVVDPMQRISMDELRQHKWFRHRLPPYLAMAHAPLIAYAALGNQPEVVTYLRAHGADVAGVKWVLSVADGRGGFHATQLHEAVAAGGVVKHLDAPIGAVTLAALA